jgi:hypothetical protein
VGAWIVLTAPKEFPNRSFYFRSAAMGAHGLARRNPHPGGDRKLLETFDHLLESGREVFSQERTFARARRLTFGLILGLQVPLTSTAICASGRQFQGGSADYRVCSRAPWDPRQWFDAVLDHLPQLLPSPEAPVFAALDDTLLKKTGRRIPGVKILRDPMSPPFHVNLCSGLRFVQVSALGSRALRRVPRGLGLCALILPRRPQA